MYLSEENLKRAFRFKYILLPKQLFPGNDKNLRRDEKRIS